MWLLNLCHCQTLACTTRCMMTWSPTTIHSISTHRRGNSTHEKKKKKKKKKNKK